MGFLLLRGGCVAVGGGVVASLVPVQGQCRRVSLPPPLGCKWRPTLSRSLKWIGGGPRSKRLLRGRIIVVTSMGAEAPGGSYDEAEEGGGREVDETVQEKVEETLQDTSTVDRLRAWGRNVSMRIPFRDTVTRTEERLQEYLNRCKSSMSEVGDKVETKISRMFEIEDTLSHYMEKKGKEIRSEMVGTAESVYSTVVTVSSQPVVKRCLIGFLVFYAFSVVWAARILLFDKKSEGAKEEFGRDLRLQKLREGSESALNVRTSSSFTETKGNGRSAVSVDDEKFRAKVRMIQDMARAVRLAEQEVFSPADSGFATIKGREQTPEFENLQGSCPTKIGRRKKKGMKQMAAEVQDGSIDIESSLSGSVLQPEEHNNAIADIEGAEPVHESQFTAANDLLETALAGPERPVAAQAETSSGFRAGSTKIVEGSNTFQGRVAIEDYDTALDGNMQSEQTGGGLSPSNGGTKLNHSTPNGSATITTYNTPAPSTSSEVKLPNKWNATSNVNGAAISVPSVSSQPQNFKSMRVITSPEEARVRIAAKKAKQGTHSAKGTSAGSVRPRITRGTSKAVESLGGNLESGQAGPAQTRSKLSKDNDTQMIRSAATQQIDGSKLGVNLSPSQEKLSAPPQSKNEEAFSEDLQNRKNSAVAERRQEPTLDEQKEEEWMRDEILRTIVLKVRDNEQAGRESFHGLDSKEEQLFFESLERKYEREGEAVKNWIQERVENLDYGLGSVGVDDPPESFMPRWKDPVNPGDKKYAKFRDDRLQILKQQMAVSTQSAPTGSAPSASTSSSSTSSSPSKAKSKDVLSKELSRERIQSNKNASGSKTIVTSSGKQSKPDPREWQHTKKWAQELQRKYDLETDPQQRALMEEVGQDLDRWITEDEINEASRLLSKGLSGEQEYARIHYEKTREKIRKQHEMFGSQGMLNKYGEYKEAKKDSELWWLDLPFVLCIGLTCGTIDEVGGQGFYSLDMTPNFEGIVEGKMETKYHTVAFQDQKDAANFCGLLLSERHVAEVIPIAPKDLYQDAKGEGFKVTVIKKGQLGLVPGQALDDVEQRIIEIGSSIYWEELERERSIDIDAVLNEGLGYGRSSR